MRIAVKLDLIQRRFPFGKYADKTDYVGREDRHFKSHHTYDLPKPVLSAWLRSSSVFNYVYLGFVFNKFIR